MLATRAIFTAIKDAMATDVKRGVLQGTGIILVLVFCVAICHTDLHVSGRVCIYNVSNATAIV